jgi:hypothetical protein
MQPSFTNVKFIFLLYLLRELFLTLEKEQFGKQNYIVQPLRCLFANEVDAADGTSGAAFL